MHKKVSRYLIKNDRLICLPQTLRFRFGKKHFFRIVKRLVSFIKNDITYMNLSFTYKTACLKSIENSYIKIHHVYFNYFNILFKTVRHRKIDFLQTRLFWISLSINIFLAIKDYSFLYNCKETRKNKCLFINRSYFNYDINTIRFNRYCQHESRDKLSKLWNLH